MLKNSIIKSFFWTFYWNMKSVFQFSLLVYFVTVVMKFFCNIHYACNNSKVKGVVLILKTLEQICYLAVSCSKAILMIIGPAKPLNFQWFCSLNVFAPGICRICSIAF